MVSTAAERLSRALDGRYRVERELGAGGMATVYLAQDLRHHRHVAVKVLKAELAAVIGAERFLAEIRTTAKLQHPHILPLFDSGEADSFLFYVMPYVEGESLRDRLNREKQLPIGDAIRIAREVASALDYAHRHQVIHRDIKPENVLLHDGQALVADFGIALAVTSAGGDRLTETGLSLGTPHYMSPEQAAGEREITGRSDVYALGAVLYEMLVGEPPFTGPTAQAIVAKVMTQEPRRLIAQRKSVPPAVEDAVLTALEKLPADRFSSAAEFAKALEGVDRTEGRSRVSRTAALAAGTTSLWERGALWGWVVAGLATAAAFWGWLRPNVEALGQPPSHLAILADGLGSGGGFGLHRLIALTPDGTTLLFVASEAGINGLMRQPLDALEAKLIPGTEGILNPLVSPDGKWLIGTGSIPPQGAYLFAFEGGTGSRLPQQVSSTSHAAWRNDGSIWFTPESREYGWLRLGHRDSVTQRFDNHDVLQQILPDDRTAIVVRREAGASSGPSLLFDLETGEETVLTNAAVVEVRYTAGHVVYVEPDGTLWAVPFDPASRRVSGTAVSIATGIAVTGTGIAQFAVASNGTIAYIPEEPRTLVFVDRSGSSRLATAERRNFHAPHFSPDGRHLSTDFNSADGRDVWTLSLDQGTLSRATFERDGHDATWTPDGRHITYTSYRGGPFGILRTRPGSATPAESLLASSKVVYTGIWLPDGSALVTTGIDLRANSRNDIAIVRNGGRGPIEPLLASRFNEDNVTPSPDGRWLAFVSDQSGQQQVYVRPLDGEGDQVQLSLSGGSEPLWGRDGRELFYRGTTELMVASVRTQPHFEVISRRALFSIADIVSAIPHTNYDISPDGRTFAMVRRSPATRIMVIQNLPELVRRLRAFAGTS